MGDVHFYNYDLLCTDVTQYPTPRFASEYGFQSFPSIQTWQPVSLPDDWTYDSDLMNHRQHHADGTTQLINEVSVSNNPSLSFIIFVYHEIC